jgi:hypothetical protein
MPIQRKVAKEWTALDLGLQCCSQRPKLKKFVKKLTAKKMRKYWKGLK